MQPRDQMVPADRHFPLFVNAEGCLFEAHAIPLKTIYFRDGNCVVQCHHFVESVACGLTCLM